jgi:hypothetical protein
MTSPSRTLFALFLCLAAALSAHAENEIKIQSLELGQMLQGENRHIVMKAENVSQKTVQLDFAISQNIGSENFKYPSTVKPGQKFDIEFDFTSAYLQGKFQHTIVIATPDRVNYIGTFSGEVQVPIRFSDPIQNLGFYKNGKDTTLTLYAWDDLNKKDFELKPKSEEENRFEIKTSQVKLDLSNPEDIKEGGNVPGFKIEIKAKNLSKKSRSIRELISFQSKTHPSTTPEIQVIGYWDE